MSANESHGSAPFQRNDGTYKPGWVTYPANQNEITEYGRINKEGIIVEGRGCGSHYTSRNWAFQSSK
jgi:hypothetical protein